MPLCPAMRRSKVGKLWAIEKSSAEKYPPQMTPPTFRRYPPKPMRKTNSSMTGITTTKEITVFKSGRLPWDAFPNPVNKASKKAPPKRQTAGNRALRSRSDGPTSQQAARNDFRLIQITTTERMILTKAAARQS